MNFLLRLVSLSGLALVIAASPLGAARAEQRKEANKKPTLLVDSTPLPAKAEILTSYADVVEPVQKAVVSITSTKIVHERLTNPILRQLFPHLPDAERESKQEGLGSGVIVSPDGYILTNNHVVEGADELEISLSDGRKFIAQMIGTDPKTDVAVVKVDADDLPVVTLADSDKIRVGDVVFAVGNPLGVGQTVTMGIVSAKGRSVGILGDVGGYEDFIQTDAAINMGNSGGALVDARGRLIGVNSAIISPSRGNIGIGFAIPINMAASVMNSLVETGTVARGYLGISTENLTADLAEQVGLPRNSKGVLISDVIPGSAAEKAGLKLTDVILAVNGHAVSSLEELRLIVARMAPGSVTKLKVFRDERERTVEVTLDRFADNPDELFTGVNVRPLSEADRRRLRLENRVRGLIVSEVRDNSPFRDHLVPDVVIMEINRHPVADLADAKRLVKTGRNFLLIYFRGSARYLVINEE